MTVTRPHGSTPSDGELPDRADHSDHSDHSEGPVGSDRAALSHRFRRPPRGRSHVTAENLAAKGDLEEDSAEAVVLRRVLERRRTVHAHLYIEELRDLASLWDGASGDDGGNGIAAGLVLRSRIGRATRRLHDAYIGVTDLPACLARVESGDLPTEWFDQLVRAVRDLPGAERRQVDETVAGWRVESLSPDRFRTLVKHLVTWLDPEVGAGGDPASRRDVFLEHAPAPDGTAFLTIVGPIPEILDLSTRLDQAARSVQDAQRHALERIAAGGQDRRIPWDRDGEVAASGRPMSLRALRYVLLTRSPISTDGVEVPSMPLRMNLTVPVLSLLGMSDAPATLEGVHPIPIDMARTLCARATVWHRVLTHPITGEFLPVAAQQYRPSAAMIEHLRLIDPVCAVPGCDRTVLHVGEWDHIEEFDHLDPAAGGPTSPENLHGLCRSHHRMKTDGALDPQRSPDGASTRWAAGGTDWVEIQANSDLVTSVLAATYRRVWDGFQEGIRVAEAIAAGRNGPPGDAFPGDEPPPSSEPDPPF